MQTTTGGDEGELGKSWTMNDSREKHNVLKIWKSLNFRWGNGVRSMSSPGGQEYACFYFWHVNTRWVSVPV